MDGAALIMVLLCGGGTILLLIYLVVQLARSPAQRTKQSSQDGGEADFAGFVAGGDTQKPHSDYNASDGGDWGAGDGGGDGGGGGGGGD
ncbi:MAG: hypothetical protein KatS3mg019_1488 [Fimbriimonadales bacterium]|nr:MAG: hypothetical protein KatS3mg019_1488 [Fimbriimonadales bacterium]